MDELPPKKNVPDEEFDSPLLLLFMPKEKLEDGTVDVAGAAVNGFDTPGALKLKPPELLLVLPWLVPNKPVVACDAGAVGVVLWEAPNKLLDDPFDNPPKIFVDGAELDDPPKMLLVLVVA